MALRKIMLLISVGTSLSMPYDKNHQKLSLNPTQTHNKSNQTCTRMGYTGICVRENYCNLDHTIETGGVIEDSDLRSSRVCNEGDWCCTLENVITTSTTTPDTPPPTTPPDTPPPTTPPRTDDDDKCLATKIDTCPWCVSLYKTSGLREGDSGLFCGGVLIGPKVVLTTATCFKTSKKQTTLHARVPGSAEPGENYVVQSRVPHQHYNSGSREYDLALFLLDREVKWDNGRKNNGACLGLRTALNDGCYAFGYNADDEFESTILMTRSGSCTAGGQGADAACGTSLPEEPCIVATGLPVICPSDTQDFLVAGIVRSPCVNSSAQLGSLKQSSSWLEKELAEMGLNSNNKMKACGVNNTAGKCVERSYCTTDDFVIPSSNAIDANSTSCGLFEDCCPEDKVIVPSRNVPYGGCVARQDEGCPWCVSLYTWPSPEHDITLFCAGLLLGNKVILTTASCYMDSEKGPVWATIPASAEPERKYSVQFRKPNNEYNLETHEHDVALFILDDEVRWANNMSNGACLDFNMSMEKTQCASFGFTDKHNIYKTDLSISYGSCHAGSVPPTSYCGNPYMDASCIVSKGAPVVCKNRETNEWVVAGIARRPCIWVPEVGALASSASWLREELKSLGLEEAHYFKSNDIIDI